VVMRRYLHTVHDRFHPLKRLRRHALSCSMLRIIDIPVWKKLPGSSGKSAYVSFVTPAFSFSRGALSRESTHYFARSQDR